MLPVDAEMQNEPGEGIQTHSLLTGERSCCNAIVFSAGGLIFAANKKMDKITILAMAMYNDVFFMISFLKVIL